MRMSSDEGAAVNNQWFSKVAVWMVIALVLFTVFKQFDKGASQGNQIGYSDFLEEVRGKRIKAVTLQEGPSGTEIVATTTDDKRLRSTATYLDRGLVGDLINNGVKFDVKAREEPSILMNILVSWGPMLLLIGVWIYFMRQMQGGGKGGAFSFGKSKARMLDEANNTTTFADVAGCDEAKEEVRELVDFLKDPQRFQKLGGRIPRGVLLVGPPGTGKTLLAKAIAGEAKVPFFSISGSDFVEMFVGVGAARVRDMFEQAKKSAPCIIFVDEIDAVGRHRGAGLGGGNDEREQTLNQMLVEMDGFETNLGVIVMAATNRPDILDPALLRPGRFDRQVYVTLPDVRGREQILTVHMRKVPVGQDIRADILARGTPGFSGADLANLVNEAALFAARRNGRVVDMVDFEKAKDKIMMGPERKSMVMPEEERKNTAYHESGHALVARLLPKTDPVHKVTVIPRDMVTRYGMTDELGPMVYAENEGEVFLGRSVTKQVNVSEQTMQKVDGVIRRIIDEQYAIARKLIEDNKDKMHAMARALLEWETIDAEQIDDIMNDRPPRPPKDWTSSSNKPSGPTPPVNPDSAPATA
jgi:cell division protease FtsH